MKYILSLCLFSTLLFAQNDEQKYFDYLVNQDVLVAHHFAKICINDGVNIDVSSGLTQKELNDIDFKQFYTDKFSEKINSLNVNSQDDLLNQELNIPGHYLLILGSKNCDEAIGYIENKEEIKAAHIQITNVNPYLSMPDGEAPRTKKQIRKDKWKKFRKHWSVSLNWGVHRVFWSPIDLHIVTNDGTDLRIDNVHFEDGISLHWYKFWEKESKDMARFLDEPQNSFSFSFYNEKKKLEIVVGYNHHRLRLKADNAIFEGHEFINNGEESINSKGQIRNASGTIQGQEVNGVIDVGEVLTQYRISNGLNRIFVGVNKNFVLTKGKLGELKLRAGGNIDAYLSIPNSVLYNDLETTYQGKPGITGFGLSGNFSIQFITKWGVGIQAGSTAGIYQLSKIPIYNGYIDHSLSSFQTLEAGITIPIFNSKRYKRKKGIK